MKGRKKYEELREGNGDNKKKKGIVILRLPLGDIVLRSILRHYLDKAYVPP